MQITSNAAFLNSFLHLIQETIQSLTPLQKKVTLIATAILASCICLYYSVHYFRAKLEEKEKAGEKQPIEEIVTDLPAGPLTTDKIKSIEIANPIMLTEPPQYSVQITLINGYKKSLNLPYQELFLISNYVSPEKIKGSYKEDTDTFHNMYLHRYLKDPITKDSANDLLVKKFS